MRNKLDKHRDPKPTLSVHYVRKASHLVPVFTQPILPPSKQLSTSTSITKPDMRHQSPKRPNLRTSDTLCVGSTNGGKGPPESLGGLLWVLPEWSLIRIVDGFCETINNHSPDMCGHTYRLVARIPLQSRVLALFIVVRIDRRPHFVVVWLREEQRFGFERGLGLDQWCSDVKLRRARSS